MMFGSRTRATRSLHVALLVAASAALAPGAPVQAAANSGAGLSFAVDVVGDHTCPDGQQSCRDGEPCCAFDPKSYGCCAGGATEECCADDTGGVCCVTQPTSCVAKNAQYPYPARCCPRETVGCGAGTVGCCNPARAWQRGPPLNPPSPAPMMDDKVLFDHMMRTPASPLRRKIAGRPSSASAHSTDPSLVEQQVSVYDRFATGDPHIAYALVVGGMDSVLTSLHINVTSGAVLQKVPVPGYNNWELATRDFAWDPKRVLFYALDVNFTGAGASRPSSGRPIMLSKINPVTGEVNVVSVTGVTDYVTGYAYHEASGRIHAAARSYGGSDGNSQPTGSTFFFVDPDTGKAEVQGTLSLTGKESDPATYGGYHRGVDAEGQTAFRLGYASVVMQASPGLGRVYSGGKADWTPMASVDQDHDWYLGMLTLNGGKNALSVAPVSATGFLDLVSWEVPSASTGKTASSPKVFSLGNVTGPGIGIPGHAGTIGYVLDAARESDTIWTGLVVIPNPFPIPFPHALDAWGIAKVNYKTGEVSVKQLNSTILSGGTSISGLGLPSLQ